jgi:hypothetical protein
MISKGRERPLKSQPLFNCKKGSMLKIDGSKIHHKRQHVQEKSSNIFNKLTQITSKSLKDFETKTHEERLKRIYFIGSSKM